MSCSVFHWLTVDSADFKVGVTSLAKLLQIPSHPDHLLLLKTISIVIKERLSSGAIEKAKVKQAKATSQGSKPSSVSIPLSKVTLGFSTDDEGTAEAAKILRLLHIHDLRELQDAVNQAIVAVQQITANPKTDTKLGKVGR
ncbi:hypothetical protein NP493_1388g00026 [Ridgeia piscesae]|uniref:Uncharacterized protein n=1 Tax=Ridgeia piscesae TaxID=27915 RepID=A0AAD9K4Y9_RIDPI|nr:hypothetical protein NP493_1388g00026 [Ridgeia piscesae]